MAIEDFKNCGASPTIANWHVLSVRFLGEDIRHAPRKWKTSPSFPGLEQELPAGEPMDHPLFPVLWERRKAST